MTALKLLLNEFATDMQRVFSTLDKKSAKTFVFETFFVTIKRRWNPSYAKNRIRENQHQPLRFQ